MKKKICIDYIISVSNKCTMYIIHPWHGFPASSEQELGTVFEIYEGHVFGIGNSNNGTREKKKLLQQVKL